MIVPPLQLPSRGAAEGPSTQLQLYQHQQRLSLSARSAASPRQLRPEATHSLHSARRAPIDTATPRLHYQQRPASAISEAPTLMAFPGLALVVPPKQRPVPAANALGQYKVGGERNRFSYCTQEGASLMSTYFIHKQIFLNLQARRHIEEQQLQQAKQRQAREQHVSQGPHIPSRCTVSHEPFGQSAFKAPHPNIQSITAMLPL